MEPTPPDDAPDQVDPGAAAGQVADTPDPATPETGGQADPQADADVDPESEGGEV
jgi:hypothetical protein